MRIAVYGIAPSAAVSGWPPCGLRCPCRRVSRSSSTSPRGSACRTGCAYRVDRDSVIATVPIGYADGVRRRLSDVGGEVLIRGRRRPIAGTVTMDQILVDCGDDTDVVAGDEVVLIGSQGQEQITAEDWANRLDTIGYEIVCGIGPRVQRRYSRPGDRHSCRPSSMEDHEAQQSPGHRSDRHRSGCGRIRRRPSSARRRSACPAPEPAPPDALFDMPDDVAHRTMATRDGGELHFIERGEGRPLVLLHGITLRADVWAPQFHQLADRYRVIAVDLRGHGTSTAGTDGYGLPRLATDVATILETLDLYDAVVAGHSMGGMTVMQFCGDHPAVLDDRVAGVVFVATRAHAVVPALVAGTVRRLGDRAQARLDAGRNIPQSPAVGARLARPRSGSGRHAAQWPRSQR